MGVVWSAMHVVTRKPVALKLLLPSGDLDWRLVQRFLREARAACAVQHPNIVVIHDVLELDDTTPMMVMELLLGESPGGPPRSRAHPADWGTRADPPASGFGGRHSARERDRPPRF